MLMLTGVLVPVAAGAGALADPVEVKVEHVLLEWIERGSIPDVRTDDTVRRHLLIVPESAMEALVCPRRRRRSDSKLTAEARAVIKEQRALGKTLRELATIFRVSRQTISTAITDESDAEAA